MILPILLLAASLFPEPRGYDVESYRLDADLRVEDGTMDATAVIRFASTIEGLRSLVLDAEVQVQTVHCDGEEAAWQTTEGTLTVDLPRPLQRGRSSECSISYLASSGRGLTIDAERAFTVFHTDRWLPSNGEIADRAGFTITLRAPAGWTIVSAGREVAGRTLADGRVERTLVNERPEPAYLLGFAAGRFTSVDLNREEPILAVHAEGMSANEIETAFTPTLRMLRFFEERAGVPFPRSRYDQVVAKGAPPQEMGGMCLLPAGYAGSVLADPSEDYLIAHELAHQWWGSFAGIGDWSHFWLQEGIATFMVAAWKEHYWGRAAYEEEIALASIRLRGAWAKGTPIALVSREAPSADRALVYSRGALLLHLLRATIGEEAFWDGFRQFTRAGATGPVDTEDFREAMEAAAEVSLETFFRQWTETPALASIEIEGEILEDVARLRVRQVQNPPFELRIPVTVRTTEGETTTDIVLAGETAAIEIPLPPGELREIYARPEEALLGTIRFERPLPLLVEQLRNPSLLVRLDAIYAIAERCANEDCAVIRVLLERMANQDPSRAVRRSAAEVTQ